jgi:hypothetical protein
MKNLFPTILPNLLICLIFSSYLMCSGDTIVKKENLNNNQDNNQNNVQSGDILLSGDLKLANGNAAGGAVVDFQSHPEYNIIADENGYFEIPDIDPGTYTIYATVEGALSTKPSSKSKKDIDETIQSAQFLDVLVSATEETTIGSDTFLTTPGSISGNIALINNPENVELVGIDIYVPGTGYMAKSDELGGFVLSNVPAGVYTVRFEKDGLSSFQFEDIVVQSAMDTNLTTVSLSLSNGPSGVISGLDTVTVILIDSTDTNVLPQNTVTVNLQYDSRAVLMKIAHESSFENIDWTPVSSQYTFTGENNPFAVDYFSTDGSKAIYVKFADLNGLESTLYSYKFIIDTEDPVVSGFTLMNGWSDVYQNATSVYSDQSASDLGTGLKEMMFSNVSDFSLNSGWLPYSANYSGWNLTAGFGDKKVYFKVRDHSDRESEAVLDNIFAGSHTIIEALTYDEPITLYKAQNPYQFTGDVTFNSDLIIEPGVTLDHLSIAAKKIIVNGKIDAVGTGAENIIITCSTGFFGGFDLSGSDSPDNIISYIDFSSPGVIGPYPFITIDGGEVSNNNIQPLQANERFLLKVGAKDLLVSSNTIIIPTWHCISIEDGSNATTIYDNEMTCIGPSAYGVAQAGAYGSVISYNTITAIDTTATPLYALPVINIGGLVIVENNYFKYPASNYTYLVYNLAGTVMLNNNLMEINDWGTNSLHMVNDGTAINSSGNSWFAGCSSSCTNIIPGEVGGTNKEGISFSAPWPDNLPTTPGPDCVGHLCY